MSAKPDNPDTTIKNLHDADVPEEFRDPGPRRVGETPMRSATPMPIGAVIDFR